MCSRAPRESGEEVEAGDVSKTEGILVGGPRLQDPENPKFKSLAEESLQNYLTTMGNSEPHFVVKIKKVTVKVVAGTLTEIDFEIAPSDPALSQNTINLHSSIWEQPWMNKKEIKVTCKD